MTHPALPRASLPHALGTGLCLFLLTGCGTDGFARDALIEDPGADTFLTRIGQQCGQQSIGNQPLDYLLDVNNNDTAFVDATSKLYLGQFNKQQYADAINTSYPTQANQAALDCIFGMMP